MLKIQKIIYLILCWTFSLYGEPNYIACIDGGGSKTSLQVIDQAGHVIALVQDGIKTYQLEAGGSNINTIGQDGVKAVLKSLFEDVKISQENINLLDSDFQIVAGMAGVALPQNKQAIFSIFEEWGIPKDRIFLTTDAEIALQLIDHEGIVLISGTGSICFGKKDQKLFRVGGLGRILEDEGSGYQISLQAIKAGIAEEYGWGQRTSLTSELRDFFDVPELKKLIPDINSCKMLPAKIASCAPAVFKKARERDPVAESIILQAAKDLGNLLITQINLSHLSDCEVHLWGGVFKNNDSKDFIQKIIKNGPSSQANLRFINHAHDNAALLYAMKFMVAH